MAWVPGTMCSPHHPPRPSDGQTTYESSQSKSRSVVTVLEYSNKYNTCYKKIQKVKGAQSCPTFSYPMDYIYSPWNSAGQNTGVGSLPLLQGIFPTQSLNPGLPHCRWILYQLSPREAQEYWSGWVIYPFLHGSS